MADKAVAHHEKVELIFNNAGVAPGAAVEGVSYEDFEWFFDVNFWGVAYGTKILLPHLEASGESQIVNAASAFGHASVPCQSLTMR